MTPQRLIKRNNARAVITLSRSTDGIGVRLTGRLDHRSGASVWRKTLRLLDTSPTVPIRIEADGLESVDGSGIALLAYYQEYGLTHNLSVTVQGLSPQYASILERYQAQPRTDRIAPPAPLNLIERAGRVAVELADDLRDQVAFLGRMILAFVKTTTHPRRFRAGDFFQQCERAGVNAMGIILMLGFLFGLIMAFSSAIPLKQFGVEVYVSDLVAIALVRVLGPFITAIVVAGRTGSAFAAEIGTMKINNELDALTVMNLDPATFLAVPRITATLLMTPLLATLTNIAGLVGAGVVILSLGYPPVVYTLHVQDVLSFTDVAVGLVKSLVFGGMIGVVGCLRGMQAQSGPGAVGLAATRAVVTAIVLLVAIEGLFSVVLYYLDI